MYVQNDWFEFNAIWQNLSEFSFSFTSKVANQYDRLLIELSFAHKIFFNKRIS